MKDASLTDKMSSSDGGGGLNDYIKLGYTLQRTELLFLQH